MTFVISVKFDHCSDHGSISTLIAEGPFHLIDISQLSLPTVIVPGMELENDSSHAISHQFALSLHRITL